MSQASTNVANGTSTSNSPMADMTESKAKAWPPSRPPASRLPPSYGSVIVDAARDPREQAPLMIVIRPTSTSKSHGFGRTASATIDRHSAISSTDALTGR